MVDAVLSIPIWPWSSIGERLVRLFVLDLEASVCSGGLKDVSGHADVSLDARRLACSIHAAADGVGTVDVQAPAIELASGAGRHLHRGSKPGCDRRRRERGPGPAGRAAYAQSRRPSVVRTARSTSRATWRADGLSARLHTGPALLSVTTDQASRLAAKVPVSRDIDGVIVLSPPPWHLEGVDFDVKASIDAQPRGVAGRPRRPATPRRCAAGGARRVVSALSPTTTPDPRRLDARHPPLVRRRSTPMSSSPSGRSGDVLRRS